MNGLDKQYSISIISESEEIYLLLRQFSGVLLSLSQGGEDFLSRMSKKFCRHGTVLAIYNRQGNAVGFAAYYDNDTQNKTGFLSMIAVWPIVQQKGVGGLLLAETERRMLDTGMLQMKLEVDKRNLSAISFYETRGYLRIGDSGISWVYQKKLGL